MDSNTVEAGVHLIAQEIKEQAHLFTGNAKFERPGPLELEDIESALVQIEELHPLSKKPIREILPWLCCCLPKKSAQ